MNLCRCDKGHFYDKEKHDLCPHCNPELDWDNRHSLDDIPFDSEDSGAHAVPFIPTNPFDSEALGAHAVPLPDTIIEPPNIGYREMMEKGIKTESKVTRVALYQSGAKVTRVFSVLLNKGKQFVVLPVLSQGIDQDSIHIRAIQGLTCHSIQYVQNIANGSVSLDFPQQEEIQNLQKSLEQLQNRIRLYSRMQESMTERVGENLTYYSQIMEKMEDIEDRISKSRSEIKSIQEQISKLQKEVFIETFEKEVHHAIFLDLTVEQGNKYEIELSYFENNVSWKPFYEAAVFSDEPRSVFSLKGNILQNTGEDWKDVTVQLLTGNYGEALFCPELRPWHLREKMGTFLPETVGESTLSVPYGADPNPGETNGIPTIDKLPATGANMYSSPEEIQEDIIESEKKAHVRDTSRQFNVTGKYNIISGYSQILVLGCYEIPCMFSYTSIPKLSSRIYQIAELDTIRMLPIMDCWINVILDDAFVSRQYLSETERNECFRLDLGSFSGIEVKRKNLKAECKKGMISSMKCFYLEYAISVQNKIEERLEIVVKDQIPITNNEDIAIKYLELSDGKLLEENGEIIWKFSLQPEEKRELVFSFEIHCQSTMKIVF